MENFAIEQRYQDVFVETQSWRRRRRKASISITG